MSISRQHTILVTGAGGAAIPALIESLRKNGYRVLAADMDPMAVGLYYADLGYVIPAGTSPDFIPALRDICRKESVTAIVPLVDEELVSALELERDGLIVLLPRQEFVALCLDKYVLMQRLKESGIAIPETRLASEGSNGMSFPLIVKPRRGRGSRGLKIVGSAHALRSHIESCPYSPDALLLQEYIDGTEYTISAVVWRDGEVQAVVPKEIISKRGITRMAVTRRDPVIESLCFSVQERLKADGPFNVQLRYDSQGRGPLIFEINPRFSTSISLTMASGIDELGGLLSQAIFGRESFMFGDWREGVVMIRKSLDEFMDEKDFNNLRRKIAD